MEVREEGMEVQEEAAHYASDNLWPNESLE